jgi:hypothetical protein
MPITFDRFPLETITFVRRFERVDVRRLQFQFEDVFRDYIKAEAQSQNAGPNAPLSAPQFVMADNKRTLIASNSSIQLSLNFHEGNTKKSLAELCDQPAKLMDQVSSLLSLGTKHYYSGLVIVGTAKIKSPIDYSTAFFEAFAPNRFQGELSTADIQVGERTNGVNSLVALTTVTLYSKMINVSVPTEIDLDFTGGAQPAVQVKIDINDKDLRMTNEHRSFRELTNNIHRASTTLFSGLMAGVPEQVIGL